jgi:hypothetical protein
MAYFEQDQVIDIRRSNDISNISFGFMRTNKVSVAIKRIKKPQTDKVSELNNHPNIVEFLGIYSIKGNIYNN